MGISYFPELPKVNSINSKTGDVNLSAVDIASVLAGANLSADITTLAAQGTWASWTAGQTVSGSFTSITGKYTQIGKTVILKVEATCAASTSSGWIGLTYPTIIASTAYTLRGLAFYTGSTGSRLFSVMNVGGWAAWTLVDKDLYGNSGFPATTGDTLSAMIIYEAA